MSNMFEKCKQLEFIDLSSFKINNKIKMNNMFLDCHKLYENFFVRVDFKQLQQLDLSVNKISDIKVLEHVDFKQLQQLDLSYNKISDIKVLEHVDFKQLQQLNLRGNKISENENSSIISYLKTKIPEFRY